MYASFFNQSYQLAHYLLSFLVISILAPSFIFAKRFDNRSDQIVSNYTRIVFYLIIFGYGLVLTKLFEVLSLFFIYIFFLLFTNMDQWKKGANEENPISRALSVFFDFFDGIFSFKSRLSKKKNRKPSEFVKEKKTIPALVNGMVKWFALFLILAYALYIRFHDALIHAAPPMSDSYVTLAWMKYINERILFHDGIYPQGFHIYLATLLKFAAIDPIYILKYTGPLNSFFIMLGMFFFIRRLTGHFVAGMCAAIAYGLAGTWLLGGSLERQIATNSQEFAFLFIFPSLYFYILYFTTKSKSALITAFLGTSVIGLVHSLAFAFEGMAIMLLGLSHFLLKGKKAFSHILLSYGLSLAAVIVSLLPFAIGKLIGSDVHSSSADYLTSKIQGAIGYTPLQPIDYLAVTCIPIIMLFLFKKGMDNQKRLTVLFTALLGVSTFLLYYAGGKLTKSILISSRAQDLWALVIPILIGTALFALLTVLPAFFQKKYVETALSILLISIVLVFLHPEPITAYKMERDSSIEQYLRIRDSYTPNMWSIVSQDEEYSVVLGSGIHMYVKDFLDYYDADKPPLTRKGSSKRDYNVPPDVFVFYEKHIFEVSKTNSIYSLLKPKYEQRRKDSANFKKWLDHYMQSGHKAELFYDDPDFAVYHFHIPQKKQKLKKRFWED